jgi:hypothetical protein
VDKLLLSSIEWAWAKAERQTEIYTAGPLIPEIAAEKF